jgi:hypothetical protein
MVSNANASQALESNQMERALMLDARISPVAAHLVAVAQSYDSPRKWLEMSAEMAELINVRYRPEDDDPTQEFSDGFFDPWDFEHPGPNGPMVRMNLNEMYYSLAGGDDVREYAATEMLEMLGYSPYLLFPGASFVDGQIPSADGPTLLLPEEGIKFVSADLAAGVIWNKQLDGRSLILFYNNGQFATIIVGQYQGTMPPARAAEIAAYLHQAFSGDFTYVKWDGSKWQSISYDEFLKALAEEQKRWVPIKPLP